jgi:metallo-beta-lactamase family protein
VTLRGPMRLRILGAAEEVTGSNYLVEAGGRRILVDCGIFQGRDEDRRNREPFQYVPSGIDAVLLTHAHMDHSGRIPLLVKEGFKGKILATLPTTELCEVLWQDSAKLMKEEAEWRTKKNLRKGLDPVEPLYDLDDAHAALGQLSAVSYDDIFEPVPGFRVRFRDAGHILGSAILEVWVQEEGREAKVVFSGDLGPQQTVMERNPAFIEEADVVVIESTYGNRLHKSNLETREEFREVMKDALKGRSKVLIPTFAVDRAQRILYELTLMQRDGLFTDGLPIFFDSPMGVKATEIYKDHLSLMSAEIQEHLRQDVDPYAPSGLRYVESVEDSQAINEVKSAIVMAGSGMCNGGRIVHHLKHNLWKSDTHVVFVGYQAQGTLGRRLVEGDKTVKVAGEEVEVKATLHTINGFSAHADRDDLLAWASNFRNGPLFVVTHGEPVSAEALGEALRSQGQSSVVPVIGQEIEIRPATGGARSETFAIPCKAPEAPCPEAVKVLGEISSLVSSLREKAGELGDAAEVLPLLVSTKTLLETARERTKKSS